MNNDAQQKLPPPPVSLGMPPLPPHKDSIDDSCFQTALEFKKSGNEAFSAGDFTLALKHYQYALDLYGNRVGDVKQRVERVNLLSNVAECNLRLSSYVEAMVAATAALDLDPEHLKSRFRRAKALLEIGGVNCVEAAIDLQFLRERGVHNTAIVDLERSISENRDTLHGKRRNHERGRDFDHSFKSDVLPRGFTLALPESGLTYFVPAQYPSIQAAIDAATCKIIASSSALGDPEICVAQGIYPEDIIFNGPAVRVIGSVKQGDAPPVVRSVKYSAPHSPGTFVLSHIQVTHGVAILGPEETAHAPRIKIDHCEISNPNNTGVVVAYGVVLLQKCKITHCEEGVKFLCGQLDIFDSYIGYCSSDGIFANYSFVLSNTVVEYCERHGIKSRESIQCYGECDVQPSPWFDPSNGLNGDPEDCLFL